MIPGVSDLGDGALARVAGTGAARPSLGAARRWLADCLLWRMTGRRLGSREALKLSRFGLEVEDPVCQERIRGVLSAFFDGFEAALQGPAALAERLPAAEPLLRPFFHEGAAMGVVPAGWLRGRSSLHSLQELEEGSRGHPNRVLRYVGVGFWLGFRRGANAARLEQDVARIAEQGLRPLVHDGYGFKVGFFDRRPRADQKLLQVLDEITELQREADDLAAAGNRLLSSRVEERRRALKRGLGVEALRALPGFARVSAFSGYGRSLWFFFMDRPEVALRLARKLSDDRWPILGGMGLAAAFTFTDDLGRAYRFRDELEGLEAAWVHKGIILALWVRDEGDPEHLRGVVERLPMALRARAEADIETGRRVALSLRGRPDFIEAFHRAALPEPVRGKGSP